MSKHYLDDLSVFVLVGKEGNFTRAAAKLGVSTSSVSNTIRALEQRLGVRLLTRTTRSVTRTEAGERLMQSVAPLLDKIDHEVSVVGELRDKPSGTVRITSDELAAKEVLWPKLFPVTQAYPDITLEIVIDYGLKDIVAERFDAGVRTGGIIDADMIAMPIGPKMRMVTVASPSYIAAHGAPKHPDELMKHRCINLRLATHGGLYPWEFTEDGQDFHVRVKGPLIFNSVYQILDAALAGAGYAQLPDNQIEPYLKEGTLVEVLKEWSEPFEGFHLYYPSRHQPTAAFRKIIEALRL